MSNAILESELEISKHKTEKFIFKKEFIDNDVRISSQSILGDTVIRGPPLTYLGFEFYSYKTLIKSANLAKFYRRMISSVKRKSKLAFKVSKKMLLKRAGYDLFSAGFIRFHYKGK